MSQPPWLLAMNGNYTRLSDVMGPGLQGHNQPFDCDAKMQSAQSTISKPEHVWCQGMELQQPGATFHDPSRGGAPMISPMLAIQYSGQL